MYKVRGCVHTLLTVDTTQITLNLAFYCVVPRVHHKQILDYSWDFFKSIPMCQAHIQKVWVHVKNDCTFHSGKELLQGMDIRHGYRIHDTHDIDNESHELRHLSCRHTMCMYNFCAAQQVLFSTILS